jgi:hypothetical protein
MRLVHRILRPLAIPQITIILIAIQVVVYALLNTPAGNQNQAVLSEEFLLVPDKIMDGEYWRLIAFLALPPFSNPICAFFFWYLFYLMGTALEAFWGTYRYNAYLWLGWLATIAAAFGTGQPVATNAFLEATVFLAFAYLNPEFQLMLFFVLPVKIKWLALLAWIQLLFVVVFAEWSHKVVAVASVANFLVFFGPLLMERLGYDFRRMHRDAARMTRRAPNYYHKCHVCGITDRTHPSVDFRYCSRCETQTCYCSDHLRDHDHLTLSAEAQSELTR